MALGDNHLVALSISTLVLLACCIQAARIVVEGLGKEHLSAIMFCCKAGAIYVPLGMIILASLITTLRTQFDFDNNNPAYALTDILIGSVDDILIFYSWPLWLFNCVCKKWGASGSVED